jgi:predicted O-methyltransferase YrrM
MENQRLPSNNANFGHQLNEIIEQQKDILAAHYLAPLSTDYLPWSAYAMRPSGLVNILNEIIINNCQVIVECGGGISTFYIARLLKSRGGHLYTIEHNPEWLEFLEKGLKKEGLLDGVTLIEAPLKSSGLGLDDIPWYDPEALSKQLPQDIKIDLLLVDGPTAYTEETQYSRYPAVPYFLPFFSQNCTIVIDDVNRQGEQEIVKRWEKLLNLDFETKDGNIAMARINIEHP